MDKEKDGIDCQEFKLRVAFGVILLTVLGTVLMKYAIYLSQINTLYFVGLIVFGNIGLSIIAAKIVSKGGPII